MSYGEVLGDFKDPVDPLIIAALRKAGAGRRACPPDPAAAKQFLTAADRTALEALGPSVGWKLLKKVQVSESHPLAVPSGGDCSAPSPSEAPSHADETSAVDAERVPTSTARMAQMSTSPEQDPSTRSLEAAECEDLKLDPLRENYRRIVEERRLHGADEFSLQDTLGAGGQGVVFRAVCRGEDGYESPAALKVFSPDKFSSVADYEAVARRMANVASRVAWPQHENVVSLQGFLICDSIRIMRMELVDGYDLRRLLSRRIVERLRRNLGEDEWRKFRQIVIVEGGDQPRVQPYMAIGIVRECLAGLASLHQKDIIHGDIKPSNVMLQRSGHAKLIDLGSAFGVEAPPRSIIHTPAYAAPEVVDRGVRTPRSDLASLGYVLVELLTGRRVFAGWETADDLRRAKLELPDRLLELLPEDVRRAERLLRFCKKLIQPDPALRFASAEDADLDPHDGASRFHQELVKMNLGCVYEHEIHRWIHAAKPLKRARES